MSPDCPLGSRWYKMAQSSHVIWDFEAERDQDCWIHRNARTAGGKRNGKLSGTLCARFKLDFQSFQNVDDMNNDAGWWYVWVHIGYCMSYMITFQFSRSLLHMFKCSSCVSILCVMVFGVPVVSENVGNEAQAIRFWCFSQGWKLSPFWPFWGYCHGYNTIYTYYNTHMI